MTTQEAISYIENFTWSTTRLGLDRTRELLHGIGDPQKKLRFIHVAGSNGKGSTCAMLASIFEAAGYRVGLYISPYIQDFCERIQLNGVNIPGERLAAITERVAQVADRMEDHPSQFELITAVGMQYFLEEKADLVVLEVGMGGALDSTNAIDAPECAVITNIGLEHTEYLGKTLPEIAATKAGIIKTGCDCVLYDGEPEVTAVVENVCAGRTVRLHRVDFSALEPLGEDLSGQKLRYRGEEYSLSLLGRYQTRNAAVVLETVEAMRSRGWKIGENAVRTGLRSVRWPARMEVLSRKPLFILDGGHNPQCAQALAEGIRALLPGRKVIFLVGILADKDYRRIIETVLPLGEKFFCLTPVSPRALPGEALAEELRARGADTQVPEDIPQGILAALRAAGEDGCVVAFGSLYLAGAVRTEFHAALRSYLRERGIRSRDSLTSEEREELSRRIAERTAATEAFRRAKTVMLYQPVRGEVLTGFLRSIAPEKRYVYPRVTSELDLEAYVAGEEPDAFVPGSFGIPEPDPARCRKVEPSEIELVLCPLTAFDRSGRRLGMGGGCYDRFLPRCTRAVRIGLAFSGQSTEKIPAEPWDVPLDAVVTENEILYRE